MVERVTCNGWEVTLYDHCWVRASKTLILLLWIFGGWGRAIKRAVVAGGPGQGGQLGFQLLVLGSLLSKDGWGAGR